MNLALDSPRAIHGYRAASAKGPTADRHLLRALLVSRCLGEISSTWIECNLNGRNDWWKQAPWSTGGSLQTPALRDAVTRGPGPGPGRGFFCLKLSQIPEDQVRVPAIVLIDGKAQGLSEK